MRYIWDQQAMYQRESGWLARQVLMLSAPRLRQWDVTTAARVDHFIANSHFVAKRIEKYYRRSAAVIHPPVELRRFSPSTTIGDYYLCAGQIVPYKKVDIAVDAFTRSGRPLVVIGSGASRALRERAGPNVRFLGAVDDAEMERHFASCQALIFPGVEDFGIVPLEVMASGRPVIAYGRGGAIETVIDGQTGLFFQEQTVEALNAAVEAFESTPDRFQPAVIRAHAATFESAFKPKLLAYIQDCVARSNPSSFGCAAAKTNIAPD